jgi:hypothetical protein
MPFKTANGIWPKSTSLLTAWMLLSVACDLIPTLPDVSAAFAARPEPDDKTIVFESMSVSNAGILRETWDFGDGSDPEVKEGKSTATHVYETPGNYNVKLTVVDKNYREAKVEDIVQVGLNQRPTATFTAAPDAFTVPPSVSVSFQASGSDPEGGPIKYHWDFGDGSPVLENGGPSPTYLYRPAVVGDLRIGETKELIVVLTVSDDRGATGVFRRPLRVTRGDEP